MKKLFAILSILVYGCSTDNSVSGVEFNDNMQEDTVITDIPVINQTITDNTVYPTYTTPVYSSVTTQPVSSSSAKVIYSSSSVKYSSSQKQDISIIDTGLVLNEVDPNNTMLKDMDGDDYPWVELYNPTASYIDLSNFYLTKNKDKVTKWQFGNVLLAPKSYLLVFLSNKDTSLIKSTNNVINASTYNCYHTNFKLKSDDHSLYLTNGIDIVDSVNIPEIPISKTWSKKGSWGFADPTPLKINTKVYAKKASAVDLPKSGFYKDSITIQFPDVDVRCTRSGRIPDKETTSFRDSAYTITYNMSLRCIVFENNAIASDIVTRTYIFEDQPEMPVMIVTANKNQLFDPDTGIYMEGPNAEAAEPHYGANYWEDKEIPVNIEFFEKDQTESAFSHVVGYKIAGHWSRIKDKKSANLYFREKYGTKHLTYPLFNDTTVTVKSFTLRNNSGNYGNNYIQDRLISELVKPSGLDVQNSRFVIVYYNGEYYGIHNMIERHNEYMIETHYGIDRNLINLTDNIWGNKEGTDNSLVKLVRKLKSATYSDVLINEIDSVIDIDNYLTYMAAKIYFEDIDWPGNNMQAWKDNSDMKWRFVFYDTDNSMHFGDTTVNMLQRLTDTVNTNYANDPQVTVLFRTLIKNDSLKAIFVNKLRNGFYNDFDERVVMLQDEIKTEISRDQKRWDLSSVWMEDRYNHMIEFMKNRQTEIEKELETF